MLQFTTTILRFDEQAEKTGWTYIVIPADIAQQLKPGNKKTFRAKGKLDSYVFSQVALMPMGGGTFIMPINAAMRKGTGKRKGAMLTVQIEVDNKEIQPPADLMDCLADEPVALAFFNSLPKGHRNYFINWIATAKTEPTKTKKIAQVVTALSKSYGFSQMIHSLREA